MLSTLFTLFTTALTGDLSAILLLAPFLMVPVFVYGAFSLMAFPVSYSTNRREVDVLGLLWALILTGGISAALLSILSTLTTYGF